MKIYTRTGDDGTTGQFAGPRVRKDAARIEAFGAVDELNSFLGLARSEKLPEAIDALLERVERQLFDLGAELSCPDPRRHGLHTLGDADVAALEQAIDAFDAQLPPLKDFVLPGATRSAALLHVARAVCRRAERRLVALTEMSAEPISPVLLAYLNRLGDLLFVLARAANAAAGKPDVLWHAGQ
jgi:cob(I)alamin adenosyltransferase